MQLRSFNQINLNDPFFDTLKEDYQEFEAWFLKKSQSDSTAYVSYDEEDHLQAFLYLKIEDNEINDVSPKLPKMKWLKVGTFKVTPHGTRLGERFVKKILDYAIVEDVDAVYVTIFPKHEALIKLLTKYGFRRQAEKPSPNGTEDVLVKTMRAYQEHTLLDYPLVNTNGNKKFILSIYPKFHTELFPDSKLFHEKYDLIQDVSHTNSIHKIYICFMNGVSAINPGDLIVIYRTADGQGSAWYRSVASSICVVEEIRTRKDFESVEDYIRYCQAYSIFDRKDLTVWFNQQKPLFIIKMTYNIALTKRLIRKSLVEDIGLDAGAYWGVLEISNDQFNHILKKGEVNEGIIIN